jgi:hypothetical protein
LQAKNRKEGKASRTLLLSLSVSRLQKKRGKKEIKETRKKKKRTSLSLSLGLGAVKGKQNPSLSSDPLMSGYFHKNIPHKIFLVKS